MSKLNMTFDIFVSQLEKKSLQMEEHPVILKVLTAPSIVYKCVMFLSALVLGIIYISL